MAIVMETLSQFSFLQTWNVLFFLFMIIITFYYVKIMKSCEEKNKKSKTFSFFSALTLLLVVHGSPIDFLSENFLFSLKMIQESITYFAIPLLILHAIPKEKLRNLLWNYRIRKGLLITTHPISAMVVFYTTYSLYHFPFVFVFFMNNKWIGSFVEIILFIFALMMWWSFASPLHGINQLTDVKKAIYLVINSILLFIPMYPLAIVGTPSYMYIGHDLIQNMTPVRDFQLGAGFVLIYQKLIVSILLGILIVKRFKKEDTIDPVNVAGLMGEKSSK